MAVVVAVARNEVGVGDLNYVKERPLDEYFLLILVAPANIHMHSAAD